MSLALSNSTAGNSREGNGSEANCGENGTSGKSLLSSVEELPPPTSPNKKVKRSWVVGKLPKGLTQPESVDRLEISNVAPRVGDCVLVNVTKVANHTRLFDEANQYSRIYKNDLIVGVLGSRYATDAYHATQIDLSKLHMLTNGGLLGTVCDGHRSMKNPTSVEFKGYLTDESGNRVNLKEAMFRTTNVFPRDVHPVFVVGTGMNSGKTTSTARLGQALADAGHKVAILKLTGSASHRDIHEFQAIGAVFAADFSDYGFPSTYLAPINELESLYCRMMVDANAESPDVVLIEVADGVYQRETEALLKSPLVKSTNSGVVLTAACAASGLAIDHAVQQLGWNPIAITGLITNAPLFVREFAARSATPVCNTNDGIQEACRLIMTRVRDRKLAESVVCV